MYHSCKMCRSAIRCPIASCRVDDNYGYAFCMLCAPEAWRILVKALQANRLTTHEAIDELSAAIMRMPGQPPRMWLCDCGRQSRAEYRCVCGRVEKAQVYRCPGCTKLFEAKETMGYCWECQKKPHREIVRRVPPVQDGTLCSCNRCAG